MNLVTIFIGSLYSINADTNTISKSEYKAKKWSYITLIPLTKLKEKISQHLNIYELAEYFDVDCKYMNDCINFYTEKYGILV